MTSGGSGKRGDLVDDGRLLTLLALAGLAAGAGLRGSRGVARPSRRGPPDRCLICGVPEGEPCRGHRRIDTSPVRLTGVLAGHPLVRQNLGPRDRDRPPLLRMTLLLESEQRGNVIIDNVITTGDLLHHPHAESRPPRKGDRVALTAWERKSTPKDPAVQWSAYEGGVQVLERIGSRGVARGARGARLPKGPTKGERWEPVSWRRSSEGLLILETTAGPVHVSQVGSRRFPEWDVRGPFLPTWDGAMTWGSAEAATSDVEKYLRNSHLEQEEHFGWWGWKKDQAPTGSRGVARRARRPRLEAERDALEVLVGHPIRPMDDKQLDQWRYNEILLCPHGSTDFKVRRGMDISWPSDSQLWRMEKKEMGLAEYEYGEHFGPYWLSCYHHKDGVTLHAEFWPPDDLEFSS